MGSIPMRFRHFFTIKTKRAKGPFSSAVNKIFLSLFPETSTFAVFIGMGLIIALSFTILAGHLNNYQ